MYLYLTRLLVRRLFQAILVLFIVGFVSFLMFRFIGDPVLSMVNISESSEQDLSKIREYLGLDKPFYMQYVRYIGRILFQGDFGVSYQYKIPVSDLILSRLSATLELVLLSFSVAFCVGIIIGIYTAIYKDSVLSHIIMFLSSVAVSIPSFIIGIFFIYMFSVYIPILPTFGRGDTVDLGFWSSNLLSLKSIKYLILPACTLGLYELSFVYRLVHAEMKRVLDSSVIRFAYLRGISSFRIYFRHALKNILPQVLTISLVHLGGLIGFSSITESIFQWPGLGRLFIESLQSADIPVLSTFLLGIALVFVLLNLIADILHLILDPRTRHYENS